MEQRFTSRQTSINSSKPPLVYSLKKAVETMTGKRVIDVGGGKFDTAVEAAKKYGSSVSIYDPYNRTDEQNASVLQGVYDVAVISNVLNVIDSASARADVLKLAAQKSSQILITVYEGNKSGVGKQTSPDSWQENRCTADYVEEIKSALPEWNVVRFGKLIKATK